MPMPRLPPHDAPRDGPIRFITGRLIMAESNPAITFEDVPLDQARRIGRGPRMEPLLYNTLRTKRESLSTCFPRNCHSLVRRFHLL
jgi:hypothetical protein